MSVLVAYASRHGATQGIAERIAGRLRQDGLAAAAVAAREVDDLAPYDAVVVGSAAYMFHWLADATRFVQRNRHELTARPLWLFSSGPLGTDPVDAKGRDQLVAAEPKEFPELVETLHPREARVFFGAYDVEAPPIGLAERLTRHLPAAARDAMPAGDFRDWTAIDAWADGIAAALSPTNAPTPA
jgi:menaquinone-dependent protoporphyrinogen oxidase